MTSFFDWLANSPMILAATTVLFFTVKGLAWLVVPALIVRRRAVQQRLSTKRR